MEHGMARGSLRIYLGAAPGVGKTYAMLSEGHRRRARGSDVVVLLVDPKERPNTEAQIGDLEVLAPSGGRCVGGVDVPAALRRQPGIALVDDYAASNAPDAPNPKRWMDVEALLAAGIDVITTLNIQHLESLSDVIPTITGTPELQTIPDAVVGRAEQIELVDATPEALRRRMAHGNIYRPERIDGALSHYFRLENLGALRELALEWMAVHADLRLAAYREPRGVVEHWETRERVVVALTGARGGEKLLRRGARMAARTNAELVAVHVSADDRPSPVGVAVLDGYRALVADLDGRFVTLQGRDVARSLVAFARSENATQLVLGASRESRWRELVRGSVIKGVLRETGPIDVHVVSTLDEPATHLELVRARSELSPRRRLAGWLLALAGTPLLAFALLPLRHGSSSLPTVLLLLLLGTVAVATVGGLRPGVATALIAVGFADWYFVPPIHTWRVAHTRDLVILVSFVVIAVVVSTLTDALARRAAESRRARAEAEALNRLASRSVLAGTNALGELVQEVVETLDVESAAVLVPSEDGWSTVATAGTHPPVAPDAADTVAELAGGSLLALRGAHLSADARRVLNAFVAQLRLAQHQILLQADAASAVGLAEANRLRTALLAAVSHDLRTPLASIKAAATSVLSREVTWSPEAIRGFCETIDVEADRLNHLVGNLLDMSRLQAGVLTASRRSAGIEEATYSAVKSLSRDTTRLDVAVPDSLPPIEVDPALLERSIANVIDNALTWSPEDQRVRVEADSIASHVELRVVDRGPGIPVSQRTSVFLPFQRLGDGPNAQQHGVGLGLAVARGFVEMVGGELRLEDTPGGGTTAVFTFPIA
jgi:two-component system sensor histidine kinase KdpD